MILTSKQSMISKTFTQLASVRLEALIAYHCWLAINNLQVVTPLPKGLVLFQILLVTAKVLISDYDTSKARHFLASKDGIALRNARHSSLITDDIFTGFPFSHNL